MNTDKEHYYAFLRLCLENGITVWADSSLLESKKTNGHWDGKANISVQRPSDRPNVAIRVCPERSTDEKLKQFIDGAPNIKWEMTILLHEYGHWQSQHPHLSTVDKHTGYQQEVEAWAVGKEIAISCGVQDFSVFEFEKEKALKGYREGLEIE